MSKLRKMFAKKNQGFQPPKPRSREDVDKDYHFHCVQGFHKSRVISQLQDEVDGHLQATIQLHAEGIEIEKAEAQAKKAADTLKGDAAHVV